MNTNFRRTVLLWGKRAFVYCLGLFLIATGVAFSVKSSLGVSPVTCPANVIHLITGIGLGKCTTATYCFYIFVEFLILRRDFKPEMLLQIAVSFFFGFLVSAATKIFSFVPAPQTYIMRLILLLCSLPVVALGVMLYLAPQMLPAPAEGLSLAVSQKIGRPVGTCKMITDSCMVALATALSLAYFHKLVGVREGTVITALSVGFVVKQLMRVFQAALLRFVERDTESERADRKPSAQ